MSQEQVLLMINMTHKLQFIRMNLEEQLLSSMNCVTDLQMFLGFNSCMNKGKKSEDKRLNFYNRKQDEEQLQAMSLHLLDSYSKDSNSSKGAKHCFSKN